MTALLEHHFDSIDLVSLLLYSYISLIFFNSTLSLIAQDLYPYLSALRRKNENELNLNKLFMPWCHSMISTSSSIFSIYFSECIQTVASPSKLMKKSFFILFYSFIIQLDAFFSSFPFLSFLSFFFLPNNLTWRRLQKLRLRHLLYQIRRVIIYSLNNQFASQVGFFNCSTVSSSSSQIFSRTSW